MFRTAIPAVLHFFRKHRTNKRYNKYESQIVYLPGALALIFLACGQKPQSEGYTITGEIAGVTGKVYLTLFEGKMPQRIDSTEVVNGTFSFTGKQPLPMLASIDTPEHGAILRFFLENSPITITGSADARIGSAYWDRPAKRWPANTGLISTPSARSFIAIPQPSRHLPAATRSKN